MPGLERKLGKGSLNNNIYLVSVSQNSLIQSNPDYEILKLVQWNYHLLAYLFTK